MSNDQTLVFLKLVQWNLIYLVLLCAVITPKFNFQIAFKWKTFHIFISRANILSYLCAGYMYGINRTESWCWWVRGVRIVEVWYLSLWDGMRATLHLINPIFNLILCTLIQSVNFWCSRFSMPPFSSGGGFWQALENFNCSMSCEKRAWKRLESLKKRVYILKSRVVVN
jgi:hypothetical protein